MFLSSKLSVGKSQVKPEDMDENQAAQAQMMKIMPVTMTAMFFFFPLPTGVYLYMVVSNIFQTLQTFIVMKSPAEPLIDPDGDDPASRVIDVTPSNKTDNVKSSDSSGQSGDNEKRKTKKKKK